MPAPATLHLSDGTSRVLARTVVIGRSPRSAPAVVAGSADAVAVADDTQISRHHLQLAVDELGVNAIDLGSGNGTVLERGGIRHDLVALEPMPVMSGDVLLFGQQRAVVALDDELAATVIVGRDTPATPTPQPAPAPAAAPPVAATPPPAAPYAAAAPPSAPPPSNGFVPGRATPPGNPAFVPGRVGPGFAPAGVRHQATAIPATFGARLWGTILDWVIYGVLLVLVIVLSVIGVQIHPLVGVAIGLVGYVLLVVTYWRQLATSGQTWGRRIAKVRVVDLRTGRPIGYGKTLVRLLVAGMFSGALFYLGYLWMLWDDKQQTWHDKAAGSVVVKAR